MLIVHKRACYVALLNKCEGLVFAWVQARIYRAFYLVDILAGLSPITL